MIMKRFNSVLLAMLMISLIITSCKKEDEEEDPSGSIPSAPVVEDPLHVYGNYFYVNWLEVVGASSYVVDVATDENFTNILNDYNAKEVSVTSNHMFSVDGLNTSTTYYVRMRAINSAGTSVNSAVQEFTTRYANVLPNEGMEDWLEYTNYDSPAPHGVWASANKTADLNPDLYHAVLFKSEESHSGMYAAKMVSDSMPGLPFITGSLSTGLFTVNLTNPLESLIIGVPYKSKPSRFQGYYRYYGVEGDSCEIRTTLSKWNTETKERETVAIAIMRDTNLVDTYTFFDIEFDYNYIAGDKIPDTIDMVFAASAGGEWFKGGIGSTLYIDDFTLIFE